MSDSTSSQPDVAELVSKAKVAMLTTTTADGKHVSRPMALQEAEYDGDLWFFAYEDSAKVQQIGVDAQVNVSFTDAKNHSWTSIAGTAQVVHDEVKAEQLWSKPLQGWFPQGLETPGLTLIKVEADSAEFWDGPDSTVAYVLQSLRAVVSKDPDKDPIDNQTVDL